MVSIILFPPTPLRSYPHTPELVVLIEASCLQHPDLAFTGLAEQIPPGTASSSQGFSYFQKELDTL